MSENASPPTPDEQPTTPLAPVTPEPAAQAAPTPAAPAPAGPAPAAPVPSGPITTAYPAGGQVAARSRMPGWAVAASIVGGVALLGIGFAGGLGTGLLVSHRESVVVERAGVNGPMMDRFGQGGGESWGQGPRQGGAGERGRLGGGRPGQGVAPGNGAGGSTQGATPSP